MGTVLGRFCGVKDDYGFERFPCWGRVIGRGDKVRASG